MPVNGHVSGNPQLDIVLPTVTSASNSNSPLNLNVSSAPMNSVAPLMSIPLPTNVLMNANLFTYACSIVCNVPVPPPFYTNTNVIPHTTPYAHSGSTPSPVNGQHHVLIPPNPSHTYPHMNVYSHPSHIPPLPFNHVPRNEFSFNPHPKLEFPKFNGTDP